MSAKVCRKCGLEKPSTEFYPSRSDCKPCVIQRSVAYAKADPEAFRKNQRRYRERHRDRIKAYFAGVDPVKAKARRALNNAIRDGKLAKPTHCSRCGTAAQIDGHHEDYTKPLEVEWLCRPCHAEVHKTTPAASASSSPR